jgi:hypothetical protein
MEGKNFLLFPNMSSPGGHLDVVVADPLRKVTARPSEEAHDDA